MAPAPATAKSITLPGRVRLSYVEQGSPEGVPVVLLHGITDSWRSYERVLPYLPPSLHVFALSLRGHGDSDRPASGYSMKDFADDVAAFIDAVGIDSAVIVGHSMGSTVAQRLAIDHPQRARALVILGAPASWRDNPVVADLARAVSAFGDRVDPAFARDFQLSTLAQTTPSAYVDTVVNESLKAPVHVWKGALDGSLESDIDARLVKAPTLLLWGDRDAIVPRADQETLDAAIADSRLVVYAGAGHALHWESPQRFAGDLLTFVQDARPMALR
jgi:pimeloyl-ACP methyl ester carboxylesterase